MRIVYCVPEISHPGGIGRVTVIKANWFAERGHDVYMITSNQCGDKDFYMLDSRIKHIDLCIGFQAGMDNSSIVKKVINRHEKMRNYEKYLRKLLYEIKADIVVSTFNNDSDFLYKLNDGSKKVLEYHFSHDGYKSVIKYARLGIIQNILQWLKIKKQEFIARKYDAFVVLTNEDAECWKGYENLHVIPNMLTIESNSVSKCESHRVIAVGRLDYQKKFDRLINIWDIVHKRCPDWKLDIYGAGPDKEKLMVQILEKGLQSVITINNPTSKIKEEYLRSSILAMTSSYEGWGLVLTEAMACGLPCIAYSCKCGPQDIITDGKDGFLVEEGDADAFARRLIQLMNDGNLRKTMGSCAKEKSEMFSLDTIMCRWDYLLNELI